MKKTRTYLVKAPVERVKENRTYQVGETLTLTKEEVEAPGFESLITNGFLEPMESEAEDKKA